jgi:arylsulfatase A-like enzyme
MSDKRPNILFIFTDQQSLRAMGACGFPSRTPHMDALAASGVRFERSYCTSPVCSPARASLMTGRMPHEMGTRFNGCALPSAYPTLGHRLRKAGYETAYTGKWHLDHCVYYWEPGDRQGFEFLTFPEPPQSWLGRATDAPTVNQAITFLEKPHERPFLLVVSLHNPHDICYRLIEGSIQPRTAAEGPELPHNLAIDPNEPEFVTECRNRRTYGQEMTTTTDFTDDHWRGYLHAYSRIVEETDVQVGRIMDALRDSGLEEDTLVVFTSDHGEGMAAHNWVVKLMLYENPVTVPLVFRWPGVIAAGRVDQTHLASGVDILPTLCDFAGVPVDPQVTGVNLRPVIERPDLPGQPFVVTELDPDPDNPAKTGRMLRTDRFKYIVFSCGQRPEMLFDLKNDPGETRNLAANPEFANELQRHRRLLTEWQAATKDTFQAASP